MSHVLKTFVRRVKSCAIVVFREKFFILVPKLGELICNYRKTGGPIFYVMLKKYI